MEKQRIRRFKNRQKYLAGIIAEEIGVKVESVRYVEYVPGAIKDSKTGETFLKETSERFIPGSKIKPGNKQRINIIIKFDGYISALDKKTINSILGTQYFVFDYNKIKYSVNPHNEGSI